NHSIFEIDDNDDVIVVFDDTVSGKPVNDPVNDRFRAYQIHPGLDAARVINIARESRKHRNTSSAAMKIGMKNALVKSPSSSAVASRSRYFADWESK